MVSSVLVNLDTLLDLTLEPGWNGDYEDFDRRKEEIENLQTFIESDRLTVYVPPFLACIAHVQVKLHFGAEQAQRVIRKILELGSSHLSIDYERVLEQSNTASQYPNHADLYDVMLLVCGHFLNVDAVVTRYPGFFHYLIDANKQTFSGFTIPILTVGALVNLVSETQAAISGQVIYAVTPQSNVIKLPSGATPIDFAYTIHTRVGDRCVRALVNGRRVSLNKPLKTGDVVEIIKDADAHPDPAWLEFVVTRTAKRGIQRGMKRFNTQQGWQRVKHALGKNIRSYRVKLEQVARILNRFSVDDLVSMLGSGEITVQQLQELMHSCTNHPMPESSHSPSLTDLAPSGTGDQNWRLASCCIPLPGDAIMGVIRSSKRLVRVHRGDCPNLPDRDTKKLRSLIWTCDRCRIQLQLTLVDQPDTFRPILNKLVEQSITPDLRSLSIADGTARATLGITISSRQHLNEVLKQISSLTNVLHVKPAKPLLVVADSIEFAPGDGSELYPIKGVD